jgi:hypothetical protein
MSKNTETKSMGTKVVVYSLILVLFISVIFSQQSVSNVANNPKLYDKTLAEKLEMIGKQIPGNQSIVVTANGPQSAYFAGHSTLVPRGTESLKELIEYMWRNKSSNLLVFEGKSIEPKIGHLFSVYGIKSLNKTFEKVLDDKSDTFNIHLFKLKSNITRKNIAMAADIYKPNVTITSPVNGSIINIDQNTKSLVNVSGTAGDNETGIKMVEVFVEDYPYGNARPIGHGNLSKWNYTDSVDSPGQKRIVAKAIDLAGNTKWYPINVTMVYK